jgi:hypothetical protein
LYLKSSFDTFLGKLSHILSRLRAAPAHVPSLLYPRKFLRVSIYQDLYLSFCVSKMQMRVGTWAQLDEIVQREIPGDPNLVPQSPSVTTASNLSIAHESSSWVHYRQYGVWWQLFQHNAVPFWPNHDVTVTIQYLLLCTM